MTTAVLVATAADEEGGPAAALPFGDGTVLARLLSQLAAQGRITSASSARHTVSDPNVRFLAVMKVVASDRAALARAGAALSAPAEAEDPVALLLVGLVRSGVPVGAVQLRDMYWARPRS